MSKLLYRIHVGFPHQCGPFGFEKPLQILQPIPFTRIVREHRRWRLALRLYCNELEINCSQSSDFHLSHNDGRYVGRFVDMRYFSEHLFTLVSTCVNIIARNKELQFEL